MKKEYGTKARRPCILPKLERAERGVMQGFQIHTESLKDGGEILLDESLDPSFLDLSEEDELKITSPVRVQGRAYRASDWIVVDAHLSVPVTLHCAMCNEPLLTTIEIKRWVYEAEPPRDGVLHLEEALREAILIEVPFYPLCNGDSCHNIAEIQQFIHKEQAEGNKPFLEAFPL
jgi:uncharacterized metal-binding protein YceD (DUF177 family)